jgi:hypothetical protein
MVDVDENILTPIAGPFFVTSSLEIKDPVYDFRKIRLSDILILCDRTIKVLNYKKTILIPHL